VSLLSGLHLVGEIQGDARRDGFARGRRAGEGVVPRIVLVSGRGAVLHGGEGQGNGVGDLLGLPQVAHRDGVLRACLGELVVAELQLQAALHGDVVAVLEFGQLGAGYLDVPDAARSASTASPMAPV